jgi:CO/xanthine dehydrogenase Mo-binding subunit
VHGEVSLTCSTACAGANVRIGAADVGQGVHLILRQIAAETLGFRSTAVSHRDRRQRRGAERRLRVGLALTLMAGRAVKDAAELALATSRRRATVRPPCSTGRPARRRSTKTASGEPHYCYGYVAQAVEVAVDGDGQRAHLESRQRQRRGPRDQPPAGRRQIEGCIAQAIGFTLCEDFRISDGRILTPNFSTYLLPTALDVPLEIYPVIMETPDPNGPFGARGMAEMPLVPFAAAVAAAIHDATGVWLSDLPFTPERVLAALGGPARDAQPASLASADERAREHVVRATRRSTSSR